MTVDPVARAREWVNTALPDFPFKLQGEEQRYGIRRGGVGASNQQLSG